MAGLCFFQALLFHPIIADRHDITEMSFKLSLNTYTPYTSRLFYLLSLSVCSNGVTLLMVHCRLSLKMMLDQKKNMCVYGHMSKKSRVGRLVLIFFFFFFLLLAKLEIVVPGSGIQYFIFEIASYAVFLPSLLSISTKS